jgi:protein tyrosine phosphatase (PTP) superfamily phosphohydrolase (DUF442 family)
MNRRFFHIWLGTLVAFLSLSAQIFAQETAGVKTDVVRIDIKNFGQMDERFFRGGQPEEDQFRQLADLGITTVINLRNDPRDFEKETVEALGMKYINIPMDANEYPAEASVQKFLEVVNDPATGKFFAHCKGGKHRAGAMGAVYRYRKYGWDFERVFREMKHYKFYTFFGKYGVIKRFVRDYGEKTVSGEQ